MKIVCALGALVLLLPALSVLAADDRPNVLFILTDDQRWDALGAYGNQVIRTPHLDALARDGARLDAFYVAAPLCNPSRASLLSGLYPHQHGVLGGHSDHPEEPNPDLPRGTRTIADDLDAAGYRTGFVGKVHLGGDPRPWGFQEAPVVLPQGDSEHLDPTLVVNGETTKMHGYITEIFADAAIAFLKSHQKDRWFLWFATTAPHLPLYPDPSRYPYRVADIVPPPGWPPSEPLTSPEEWALYYSTITMADEQIGRVLAALDELGLRDRTLVFFTSDNGYMWGSHGQARKQVWFEESARTPALARWPGHVKAGLQVSTPVSGVDLLPTFLDAAGQHRPPGLEGVSMLPALEGRRPLRTIAFAEVQQGSLWGGEYWQMARDPRFKYARVANEHEHLYDLVADPHEERDLAAAPAEAAVRKRLRRALADWVAHTPRRTK